jgi:hypothetical protein
MMGDEADMDGFIDLGTSSPCLSPSSTTRVTWPTTPEMDGDSGAAECQSKQTVHPASEASGFHESGGATRLRHHNGQMQPLLPCTEAQAPTQDAVEVSLAAAELTLSIPDDTAQNESIPSAREANKEGVVRQELLLERGAEQHACAAIPPETSGSTAHTQTAKMHNNISAACASNSTATHNSKQLPCREVSRDVTHPKGEAKTRCDEASEEKQKLTQWLQKHGLAHYADTLWKNGSVPHLL